MVMVRCYVRAGYRRSAFRPTRICRVGNRIPRAIPRDIATMSNRFPLPRRRRFAQTHSSGVSISSITAITGRLTRLGKAFGELRSEVARCVCSSRRWSCCQQRASRYGRGNMPWLCGTPGAARSCFANWWRRPTAPLRARSACHLRRSLNMPKRPLKYPPFYRRRRPDSRNLCSISFLDQSAAAGGVPAVPGAFYRIVVGGSTDIPNPGRTSGFRSNVIFTWIRPGKLWPYASR